MYQGARLDPNKPLAAYGLPKDPATGSVEDHPVFLYCRSYLKPGAALPPPEALPQIQVQVPPLAEVNLAHPLHAAASPLVRALPDYERHFTHHLATTRAYWDVAQRRLGDLYPVARLREWADTCARSHASFGGKVGELEALFQALRRDVEALFMQAPSVDLDALGRRMTECEGLLDEHSSMVQVLSKDLRTVRALVEDVAAEASKVAMSADVLGQLQRISGQQSRIRDMKNKLAAFNEVLARQDAAFSELKVVHRCACGRRFAKTAGGGRLHATVSAVVTLTQTTQLYCGQAGRLAEHMTRFREKEAARRAAFGKEVARYLPTELLTRAGLAAEPPHCQHQGHGRHGPSQSHHTQQHGSRSAAAGGAGAIPGTVAVLDADPPPPADPVQALEMENARLRAELANHIAAACVRELESMQQPTTPATPARQQSTDSSTGTPPASAASASAALQLPQRRALAMKDDLIRQQQRESATLSARAAAYEERIAALEALLARQASLPEAAVAGGIGSGRNSLHGAEGADAAAAAGDAVYGSAAEDGVVAIPGRTTGGNGPAAAHASPGGAGRYGGSCMPMAIGSLPFATSLPAASLLPGSVIPGAAGEGEGGRAAEDGERAGGAVGDGSPVGGSSSSSSSALQFRPSWSGTTAAAGVSAPASGEEGQGQSQGDGKAGEQAQAQAPLPGLADDVERAADAGAAPESAEGAGAAALAGGEGLQAAAGRHHDGGGQAHDMNGEESDDAEAPDIDEVIDSGGASGDAAGPGAMELVQEGEADAASGSEAEVADAVVAEPASSGYETVGSVADESA
eukprot:XP_001698156.1 predicted protein [Chlamydomonas reinhardtii]